MPESGSASSKSNGAQIKCWGLLSRKERWGLSFRGWFAIVIAGVLFSTSVLLGVHPFLAAENPIKSEVLAVEGWIPEDAVRKAGDEFKNGGYKRVFAVGGPLGIESADVTEGRTYAHTGAEKLELAGISKEQIQVVPTRVKDRDRTYASAIALRSWFEENGGQPHSLNVVTLSVHARRTHLLYEKAFGPSVDVGIIAIPNERYVAARWWRYSEGVKEVVSESAAYLYARFLFRPENPGAKG